MKHGFALSLLALPFLAGCTTDPYTGRPDLGSHMTAGILGGAAAGALGGHFLGVNPVVGAAAGMVMGGALGATTTAHQPAQRRFYKDARGYCYFIDTAGQPQYDYTVKC